MSCLTFLCAASMTACAAIGLHAAPPASELDGRIQTLSRAGAPLVHTSVIGQSREGRPIHLIRLGAAAERNGPGPDDRPALLIIAGANGDHAVGTDVALGLVDQLVEQHAEALRTHTVYVVPRLNPDAAAVHERGGLRQSWSRTTTPDDADGDGRIDEDGPDDVNGDGVISMMRIKNPPPWLKAEWVVDGDEPRLMRAPKPEEGESAQYALLIESIDNDGDGKFAEDGPGGVALDKNFMHQWPEHTDGAGLYPLSEPESRSLVEWMLERRNIAAVLVYGPHDTLVKIPQAGKMDVTGQAPIGIENGDKAFYEKISEVFKDISKMKSAPEVDSAGAIHAWAYAQFSVPSFATPIWVRPDQLESAKKEGGAGDKKDAPADKPADAAADPAASLSAAEIQAMVAEWEAADDGRKAEMEANLRTMHPALQARIIAVAQGQPDPLAAKDSAPKKKGKADEQDVAWLKYSDEQRNGEGFIEWTEFDHPQLGAVEIGGFAPGFQMNPPAEELPRLIDEQTTFALELMSRLPRVTIEEPRVERVGPSVWRVTVEAVNDGYFPTMLAIAKKTRRVNGTMMQIDLPEDAILVGDKTQITRGIDGSGGRATAQWLIAARDGEAVDVIVRSPTIGERRLNVDLEMNRDGGDAR